MVPLPRIKLFGLTIGRIFAAAFMVVRLAIFMISILAVVQETAAQSLTVRDANKNVPVEGVAVTCAPGGTFAVSNKKGEVNLASKEGCDSLLLSHVGYESKVVTWNDIMMHYGAVLLTPKAHSLPTFVVSANKWEQEEKRVSDQITVLDARAIELANAPTSADLLSSSGEVFVQKSQLGGGSPMIRGFAANRVLIVVDGVRMNNAIYRSGNLQNVISVDPNAVEHAEVIHGPGAMTYGSDAIGGVMDFHMLTPKFSTDSGMVFNGGVVARYGSAAAERTRHLHLGLGGKKVSFVGSATFVQFDDLLMGRNGPDEYLRNWSVQRINNIDSMVANDNPQEQISSGYDAQNYLAKFSFRPSEKFEATVGLYHATTGNVPRYDRLIELRDGEPRSAEWYYGPQRWSMANLQMLHRRNKGIYNNARLTVAYQQYEESRNDRNFRSEELRVQEEEVKGVWANLDMEKRYNDENELYYGLEFVTNDVGSKARVNSQVNGEATPIVSRYPDGSNWSSASAYVSTAHELGPRYTLNGGVRYSLVSLNADFDTALFAFPITTTTLNNGALTGSAGIIFRPDSSWKFGVDVSTGFRSPNIDDIGKVFDSEPGAVVVPNTDLSPEYAYNFELSAQKQILERTRISANGFYTILTNALVRRPFQLNGSDSIIYQGELSEVQALQNVAQAVVYGFHVGVDQKIGKAWAVAAHYNWQKGTEEDDELMNAPSRHAPPPFGTAKVSWSSDRLYVAVSTQFSSAFAYDQLAPSEQAKPHIYAIDDQGRPYSPAWFTIDAQVRFKVIEVIELTAGVENITDQRYRTYSSGIVAPGRNLLLALRMKW